MKKINYFLSALTISLCTISCSNSVSDDFDDMNNDAVKKRLKKISTNQNGESLTTSFSYDGNSKLTGVSSDFDGEATSIQYTNTGDLLNISGQGLSETLNLEELFQSPYNAYQLGQVVSYDDNRNPSKISFQEEVYNYNSGQYETIELTADIIYDEAPNMYFSTLEAAGVIAVLDKVQLDFSMNPQASELVKASELLPMNNPIKFIYKDENGNVSATIDISYTYDQDNYPINAIAVLNSGSSSETSAVNFSYN
ncbi:hypothetical protein [Tenacibaculum jejuense]|uniref:Uncharacterized protein n=1 Tax=Tenacibaculum jejuense TaxID=584609 RepID=A0A238UDS1_9FLAO|nr:hypothetical protein [Tenacibaculum jejuense]SNR17311.1 conserved protein of unknown function [Tenacibaculum jejuense]